MGKKREGSEGEAAKSTRDEMKGLGRSEVGGSSRRQLKRSRKCALYSLPHHQQVQERIKQRRKDLSWSGPDVPKGQDVAQGQIKQQELWQDPGLESMNVMMSSHIRTSSSAMLVNSAESSNSRDQSSNKDSHGDSW